MNGINRITAVGKSCDAGDIMFGHVYWDKEFSAKTVEILTATQETGEYDDALWKQILLEKVNTLPPMTVRTYANNVIYEFDSLDELRQFDSKYIKNTHSKIMANIAQTLHCGEEEIVGCILIKGGIDTSFVFEVKGQKHVYRYSSDGTAFAVSRMREK